MANLRSIPFFTLATALLLSTASIAQQPGPAARIVNPIDESQLAALKGTVHPLANAANDRGRAPDDMQLDRLQLVLNRSASQESALRLLIAQMHTPGSAGYHKWLTPDQFGAQFGPSDQDIATVKNWLTGHGFSVAKVNPGKQTIEISGNVAQMRSAFHTEIHKYAVNGETHYANSIDPQIPAALMPVVGGFMSLNNFRLTHYSKVMGKAEYDARAGTAKPEWTIGSPGNPAFENNYVLSPADFAVQYDLNKLYSGGITGAGQTIAIVNDSNVNIDLVNQFRTLFLPGYPLNQTQVIIDGADPGVDGINNYDGPNYDSVEAYLDVEWSGAVAPGATIDLVIAADTAIEGGVDLALLHAVYGNVAPVISLSFGACEQNLGSFNQTLNQVWEQAAAQGITVVVSAGDSGSASCDNDNVESYAENGQAVSGFASTPFNVAVGGTDFYYSQYNGSQAQLDDQLATYWNTTPSNSAATESLLQYIPEQAWNDSQYGLDVFSYYKGSGDTDTDIVGGGGGASTCATMNAGGTICVAGYAKPAWQKALVGVSGSGMPNDGVRDLPDVSLFAANGYNGSYYPECSEDGDCQAATAGNTVQITGVGGTSASAPAFAGIMALVNQQTKSRQGQAGYVLYPLFSQFRSSFHDVTVGANSVPCEYSPTDTANCIAVSNPITLSFSSSSSVTEGEIGTGTTAEYNAGAGYDLATGLGSIDAYNLVTNWDKIAFAASSTTLGMMPSSTTFAHGTALTISGAVTGAGTPGGDVALMTDSTQQLQAGQTFFTLSSGAYSSAGSFPNGTNFLPGGTYHIWGQYGGDVNNAPSSSTPVQVTVTPESSAIDFNIVARGQDKIYEPGGTSPGASVDYGAQMLLSAAVAPTSQAVALEACLTNVGSCSAVGTYTDPTGVVSFIDNGAAISTSLLSLQGEAEFNAPFVLGAHSVTVSYGGDDSYKAAANPAPIAFTVVQDAPQILYSWSSDYYTVNPVNATGQPTVLTFAIENTAQYNGQYGGVPAAVAPPTGSVTVSTVPASGLSGTQKLSPIVDPNFNSVAGVADYIVPPGMPTGNYSVTLSYSGDSNYLPVSGSAPINIENLDSNGLKSSTTTATMTGSITPNSPVVITGSVTGSGTTAPTGGVAVYESGATLTGAGFSSSTGNVSYFTVVVNSQSLVRGTNYITVQFPGDKVYNPSAMVLSTVVENPLSDFTMVPNSTIVPVGIGGGAGSGTAVIDVSSVNGFTGTVNLSCAAAAPLTCAVAPNPSLSNNSSANSILTVSAASGTAFGTYNVMVTGKDSTGEYIHALGFNAVVNNSTVLPGFELTNSGNITVVQGAATGNTSTITVTPTGGFTGTANLACAVADLPIAGSYTAPTCAMATPAVSISGVAAQTDLLTITTSSTTFPTTWPVTITGTSGGITETTVVDVIVTAVATPAFNLSATAPASISPGSSVTSAITATGSNGYAGTITFTCAPTSSSVTDPTDPPTCTGGSAVVLSASTTSGTSIATVNTTAATSGSLMPARSGWFAATGGSVLAAFLLFFIPGRSRRWRSILGAFLLVAAVSFAAIGCGGGLSGNTGPTTTTPTVTVTPASSSIAASASLSVTVAVSGSSGTATGTVTLSSGSYTSPATTLSGGAATILIPANSLPVGSDTLTASYSGDSNYNSASGAASVTVTSGTGSSGTSAGNYTFTVTGTGNDAAKTTAATTITVTVN
jgi:hypothetical protein